MSVVRVMVTSSLPRDVDFKVNKWLALKRRASGQPAVSLAAHSCPGPSRDVNGNRKETPSTSHHVHVPDVLRLPYDPRSWTPQDVSAWLRHMTETHDLEVDTSFFQMNGRGLCLMPLKGFLFRVPDHGKLLYEEFRDRLRKCLLAPGNRLMVAGNEAGRQTGNEAKPKRRRATPTGCHQGVLVAGRSSMPDCKGRMSPLTYHTL